MISFSFRKVFIVSTVVLGHIYNICAVGLCMSEVCGKAPRDLASTVAILAAAIILVESKWPLEYIKPLFPDCNHPNLPLEMLSVHLMSNIFWNIIWRPAIVPIAFLSSMFGAFFMFANSVLGGDRFTLFYDLGTFFHSIEGVSFVQIVIAFLLLRIALALVGIVKEIVSLVRTYKCDCKGLARQKGRKINAAEPQIQD